MKGYQIRQLMSEKKVKVIDIALQLNISHAAVSNVIHGRSKSSRISNAIADAIDEDVSELWPEQTEKGKKGVPFPRRS